MNAIRTSIIVAILTLLTCVADAATLRVSLDGSQPYTVIQEAINASAHSDTVLVYPGRYYENIRFYGKNITLASLELVTGEIDYKQTTILDGSQIREVIQISDNEVNFTIRGFTITNGIGFYIPTYDMSAGGGIVISRMTGNRNANIINCIVKDNNAELGGGIWCGNNNLFLSGVSIFNNRAATGGGLVFSGSLLQTYRVVFDSSNRCSVYNNYAARGCELFISEQNQIHVVVDTFTVANPSNFYASAIPSNTNIINPYTFDILNSVHTEINHDLYVAPWGDDANDGLSEATPLKTIFKAVYNIASDALDPKTVHLAEGYYSQQANDQFFPLSIKNHTRLSGKGMDKTIIDYLNAYDVLRAPYHSSHVEIEKISFINSKGGIKFNYSEEFAINDLKISQVSDIETSMAYNSYVCKNQSIENCVFQRITSPRSATGVEIGKASETVKIRNTEISGCVSNGWMPTALTINFIADADVLIDGCRFFDNVSLSPDTWNSIMQILAFSDVHSQRMSVTISNSAFYNNSQAHLRQMSTVYAKNDLATIRNCTFAGNIGGSSALALKGNAILQNNVFWNPQLPNEVTALYSTEDSISGRMEFDRNCIRGGINGIYNMSPLNQIVWHDSNLALDPIFAGNGNNPYLLSPFSPLIDAGLQLQYDEPALDAGGNERYWDGDGDGYAVIDVGAYEYQPLYAPQNLNAELWQDQVFLSWEMPQAIRGLSGYRIFRNHLGYADIFDVSELQFCERPDSCGVYTYQVAALYGNVLSALSDSVVVYIFQVDSQDELVPLVTRFSITPNPFSQLAVIHFALSRPAQAELKIYNLRGQLIRTLGVDCKQAGEYHVPWEGCDDNGRHISAGIYFLRPCINGKAQTVVKLIKLN